MGRNATKNSIAWGLNPRLLRIHYILIFEIGELTIFPHLLSKRKVRLSLANKASPSPSGDGDGKKYITH